MYLPGWFCCLDDISIDILPASECVDAKPPDPSPIPLFPHTDLDSSEVSEGVSCVSMCTEKSKGRYFISVHVNNLVYWTTHDLLLLFNILGGAKKTSRTFEWRYATE